MCGENEHFHELNIVEKGSSPRVRGKRSPSSPTRRPCGLIPACAGKTASTVPSGVRARAHPRVCGENLCPLTHAKTRMGSSPRVRGKRTAHAAASTTRRLIPACAGKTAGHGGWAYAFVAHPRVCGENFFTQLIETRKNGSSPRVRGKPRRHAPRG